MQPLLGGKAERPLGRRAVVLGLAALAVVAMVGLVGLSHRVGGAGGGLDELSEEDLAQMPRMDTGDFTQKLVEKFDASKIYDDEDPTTDLTHPNRIDDYGCLFSNCEDDAGAGSIIKKVSSLKKQLSKFMILQRNLDEKLNEPVQTTMAVTAGEPGRLGPRGPRGQVGRKGPSGPRGDTGRPGFPGRPGRPGKRGPPGYMGRAGSTGAQGPPGAQGPQGEIGPRGGQGPQGKTGPRGPRGYKGDKGVEGQPGQKGNMGPKGLSPVGPEGPRGAVGAKGKRGPKGKQGPPGPNGYKGSAGGTGPTGASGPQGKPGKDAKQWKGGKCGVTESTTKDNICCGRSQVHWNTPYGQAAGLTINTQQCRFKGSVMYFPTIKGNGYQWTLGGAAISSSGQRSFTVRTTAIPSWPGHHVGRGNYANAYRWVVSWCGVGQTDVKPKNSVCCETYNPDQHWNWWHWGGIYTYKDTSRCQFKGTPHYMYNIVANSDTYGVSGASSFYNGYRPWNKMFLIFPSFNGAYAWRDYHHYRRQKRVGFAWCGIGDTFPTGQMQLGRGKITEDKYPCQGVRMIERNVVKSNTAEVCCGVARGGGWRNIRVHTRTSWHHAPVRYAIEKYIDTSKCGFKGTPVWLTSLKGRHSWSVTGSAAYSQSSAKGFKKQLMGWREDATHLTAAKAQSWGWEVQWCGFGVK